MKEYSSELEFTHADDSITACVQLHVVRNVHSVNKIKAHVPERHSTKCSICFLL
jgi:hypothetical protein